MLPARHVSVSIASPPEGVYRFVRDARNLSRWAAGLGRSVGRTNGAWIVESPMGRVRLRFAPRNAYGVLDHAVVLPSGEEVLNPMRVVPNGNGSEIVFSLFRRRGVPAADFEADARQVLRDLRRLKRVLETRSERRSRSVA